MSLANLRRDYSLAGLKETDLAADPFQQFQKWFQEAVAAEILEPNAMVLATVDSSGQPSTRVVLLKGVDERGFRFFTSYESRKGRELAANPKASLTFQWLELERQVCITGRVTKLSRKEAEDYFRIRPRGSRLGAWASQQSQVIADRAQLEARVREVEATYPGDQIPLPPYWGGYVLAPREIEFWQGRPSRLHDRLRYTRHPDNSWKIERLSP
ncbi:MAG TPA: pyridoxamine 5'-phosphate oxidase [Candidatus Binatia bacterium]|nr:pyridoxamine 5'-phosphate oxidase [Candidatus Binatia bacterium]